MIQLPQTGQTTCYDAAGTAKACAGTMQDGNIKAGVAWPNPRFSAGTDIKASCVTDNLTGLMWTKNGNSTNYMTWQETLDYIADLNQKGGLCGYRDWRLPNINEIESLVNPDKADIATWLNGQGFSDVQITNYWSSTTYASNTDYAWVTNMWDGKTGTDVKSNINKVWPVRAGQSNSADTNYPANIWMTGQTISYHSGDDGELQKGVSWPNQRFTDNQNGTVTDNLTGLMWLKDAGCFVGQSWQASLDKVKDFNANPGNYDCSGYKAGYNDWRLPNRKELFSLTDYLYNNPALPVNPPHPFVNMQSIYWSATTYAYKTESAWIADMWDGKMQAEEKYYYNYMWPVRSGVISVNNNCTAILLSTFHLNIPIIVFSNLLYEADLEYLPSTDGNIWFKVVRADTVNDATPYNNCPAAALSDNYKLSVQALSFNNISYQANFEYAPGAETQILFKLNSAQQN